MKVCFRPFGVGFEDVETSELKGKAVEFGGKATEIAKTGSLIAIGLGVCVAELLLRKTTQYMRVTGDAILDGADVVDGVHDKVIEYAVAHPEVPVMLEEPCRLRLQVKQKGGK